MEGLGSPKKKYTVTGKSVARILKGYRRFINHVIKVKTRCKQSKEVEQGTHGGNGLRLHSHLEYFVYLKQLTIARSLPILTKVG